MRNLAASCIIVLLFSIPILGQIDRKELMGAWEFQSDDPATTVAIVGDGYFSITIYNLENKEFVSTFGGAWQLEGNTFKQTIEYHSSEPSEVGSQESMAIALSDGIVTLPEGDTWTRIDDGSPGALAGAWLITGRERDGAIVTRTPGPRKTMKILSGTRFQWIAYNTETKEFSGTGGGTYTTDDGKYVEHIEFFSRDSTRVGAALEFDFELKDGDWHHKGNSSKGDPIYEVWSLR